MMVPNTFNSVMRPDQLMCVCFDVDPDWGGDGMRTVMIISRPATNIAWNYFGNVWMSTWPPTQPLAEWFTYVVGIANVRINEVVGEPSTPPIAVCPPGPANMDFDTVKAWFLKSVKWEPTVIGGWNLVPGQQGEPRVDPPAPTPAPTSGAGKPGNGWLQFTAGQQDMAFRTVVGSDGVQRFAIYRKDGPGQFTWVPPALTEP